MISKPHSRSSTPDTSQAKRPLHAIAWTSITDGFAGINGRELPSTTPDFVDIDHRQAIAMTRGNMIGFIQAALDDAPNFRTYLEAVHRLTNLGAVVTQVSRGTSHQGFEAEWRNIDLLTVDGDVVNRAELFDETDLDAALARFDELSRPAPRLENAASRMYGASGFFHDSRLGRHGGHGRRRHFQ